MKTKVYQNLHSVDFMIWETKEHLRAVNNNTNVITDKQLKVGDLLITSYGNGVSTYTISEISNKRQANTSDKAKMYYELKTIWTVKEPTLFKTFDLSDCNYSFNRFIDPLFEGF